MSRRIDQNSSRGKDAKSSNSRTTLLKLTVGRPTSSRGGHRQAFASKKTIRPTQPPSGSDAASTSSGDDSDDLNFDDETEDADDESEELEDPDVDFPSHLASLRGGAGSTHAVESFDQISEPETWTGFPDSVHNFPEWLDDEEIKKTLFDSDDDQVYEKVNEVSDSDNDEDEEALERAETAFLESQLQDEFSNPWASHFANQIDGMSAYGFGDDSDEGSNVFAFSGSDDLNEPQARRVHFEEPPSPALEKAMAVLADSPTISRSLLPAALQYGDDIIADDDAAGDDDENEDDYDSDATVELAAPAQAWRSTANHEKSNVESTPPMPTRKPAGQKGPVRGTFEDSGDKVTAILDSTGKKLLLSDPHLLGGIFARRFGPSVPGSPGVSFEEAVFGESDSSEPSQSPVPLPAQPIMDLMLPGLTSGEHISMDGHAIGFPEAFMPHDPSFLNEMCPRVFDDDDDANDPEKMLRIQDMITFDGDNESEDHDYRPSFPSMSAPSTPLAHLNNMNVSAFKRKAESTYMSRSSNLTALINKHIMSPSESSSKRKRKSNRYSSPYKDAHYQGVTPVQRMAYHEHPSSPAPQSSAHGHKRRKTMY